MFFKLHDVVKIGLNGLDLYVKIVPHRHSLGFTSIFADDNQSINLDVLTSYKITEVVCSVDDEEYKVLYEQLSLQKAQQLRVWEQMDAQGWNRHELFMHERLAPLN